MSVWCSGGGSGYLVINDTNDLMVNNDHHHFIVSRGKKCWVETSVLSEIPFRVALGEQMVLHGQGDSRRRAISWD